MVKRSGLLIVLLACSAVLTACGATPPAVSATMQQITLACQTKDKKALKACYARLTAPDDLAIEQSLGSWDEYFTNWTYSTISFKSLAEMAADPNGAMIISAYQTQKIPNTNIVMGPNLPVIGFISVRFTQSGQAQAAGEDVPIGLMPDGTAKIVTVRQVQNDPAR